MPARITRRRRWVYPIVVLSGIAVAGFFLLYTLDRYRAGSGGPLGFFDFDPGKVSDSIGSLAGMIAAVLGIVITVASIIVQLAAERYTQVTEMFFRDRTNMAVMGFYVVGCVCSIFVAFSLGTNDFVPKISLTVMLVISTLCFAMMAPYFAFVFDFLQPQNIIGRIRNQALDAATTALKSSDEEARGDGQAAAISGMEQLTDITINSISGKDKIIATAGVDALKDFAVRYLAVKKDGRAEWFAIGKHIRENPDFVSMSPESVDELAARRTWVEWKLLRQYQSIYSEALAGMRDINYVIAIDTRYIGEAALRAGDLEALALCVKFFNTYMRATLNANDVRTCYNILNQYRQLGEAMLRGGLSEQAVEVAGHFKYYAHTSMEKKLWFVTETIAYDLCAMCELAHHVKAPAETTLLQSFLQVDDPAKDGEVSQDMGLRGVRKAQVKLATYYLVHDAEPLARRIFDDMSNEKPERLRGIRDELANITSKDFWEVIDRGTNFDYLPPDRKEALKTFFGWFNQLSGGHPRAVSTTQQSKS